MIDIKSSFKVYLKDITICVPTYPAMLSSKLIPAPTVATETVKASLQRKNSKSTITPGLTQEFATVYMGTADYEEDSYLAYGGDTYIRAESAIDIAELGGCTKINVYKVDYKSIVFTYVNPGSAVGGSWVPGVTSTATIDIYLWDPKSTPDDFIRRFILDFDYRADGIYGLTHPGSAVPPIGATTTLNGIKYEIVNRGESRDPNSLGYLLVLRRHT